MRKRAETSTVNNIEVSRGGSVVIRGDDGSLSTFPTSKLWLDEEEGGVGGLRPLFAPQSAVDGTEGTFRRGVKRPHPMLREKSAAPLQLKRARRNEALSAAQRVQYHSPSSFPGRDGRKETEQNVKDMVASDVGPEVPTSLLYDDDVEMDDLTDLDMVEAVERARSVRKREERQKQHGTKTKNKSSLDNEDVEMREDEEMSSPDKLRFRRQSMAAEKTGKPAILPPSSQLTGEKEAPAEKKKKAKRVDKSLMVDLDEEDEQEPASVSASPRPSDLTLSEGRRRPPQKAKRQKSAVPRGEAEAASSSSALVPLSSTDDEVGQRRRNLMHDIVSRRLQQLRGYKPRSLKGPSSSSSSSPTLAIASSPFLPLGFDARDVVDRPRDRAISQDVALLGYEGARQQQQLLSTTTNKRRRDEDDEERGEPSSSRRRTVIPLPAPLARLALTYEGDRRQQQQPPSPAGDRAKPLSLTWAPEIAHEELKRRRKESKAVGERLERESRVSGRKKAKVYRNDFAPVGEKRKAEDDERDGPRKGMRPADYE